MGFGASLIAASIWQMRPCTELCISRCTNAMCSGPSHLWCVSVTVAPLSCRIFPELSHHKSHGGQTTTRRVPICPVSRVSCPPVCRLCHCVRVPSVTCHAISATTDPPSWNNHLTTCSPSGSEEADRTCSSVPAVHLMQVPGPGSTKCTKLRKSSWLLQWKPAP